MGPKHGLREGGGCGCGAAWPVPPVRRRCVPVVMCPARAAVEHQDGVHYGCPECSVLQPGRPSAQGTSKSIHGAGRAPALAGLQKDEVLIRAEAWPLPQAPGTACVHHTAKGQSLQEAESTRCTHPSSHPETPGVWPTAAPLVGSLEAITGIPGLCLGLGDEGRW